MKLTILHTVVKNYSRYPIDIVWENAQDLEHVAWLHQKTNKAFTLLNTTRHPDSPFEYETMSYCAVRRLPLGASAKTWGMRRIVGKYNIQQLENIPLLGITSMLNSILRKSGRSDFPTEMVDEVVMEIPVWMAPFKSAIIKRLNRHAKIQCAEDEPFRERRQQLLERGIRLPFRIYNESVASRISGTFKETT